MACDAFGQELNVGDIITYPVRHSSVMHIRAAIIKELSHYGYDQGYTAEGTMLKVIVVSSNYDKTIIKGIRANIYVLSRVVKINDIKTEDKEIQFLQEIQKQWKAANQSTNTLNQ